FSVFFFFSSRRRHTRSYGDWSSDVCSSDLAPPGWPVNAVSMPSRGGIAAAVQIGLPPGRRPPGGRNLQGLTIYIDPVSLKVLRRDRKSTRLNSSHRTISYAVFCLKKKKKKK